MSLQAMQAWVPVDITEAYKNVLDRFENKNTDRFIKKPWVEKLLWMWWMWGQPSPLEAPQATPTWAAETTQAVAQGSLTAGM
jgi:hypothetical protein